jgi:hypothetical protein
MSQLSAPFGLRPAFSSSGIVRPGPLVEIVTAYATDIFQNDVVAVATTGFLEEAAAGARAIGTFQGVQYVDADGQFRVRNRWTALTAATEIRAFYTVDQGQLVYEIQADATLTVADIGQQFDWNAPGGNATTGLSSNTLDVGSAAANAGLRVIGLNPGPDNDWGDPFPIVLVQISQHQYVADLASV